MNDRHPAIVHWSAIEDGAPEPFRGTDEPMSFGAAFGQHFGLLRLGLHHMRLTPGQRTSLPHAESVEDEFVYVIAGRPDVWLDGGLYPLVPGDGVGFPAGTGLAHSFLNNSETEVELLVVGDTDRVENRIVYPINPERKAWRQDWWHDTPKRALGSHDGLTDLRRGQAAATHTETGEHPAIVHWTAIENPVAFQHRDRDEPMSRGAAFGRHFGLKRLGIHHERLLPGRRTSLPHAESAEEEFVYVIAGSPDVWLDRHLYPLVPGDGVGFPAGTGLAHTFINNTGAEVELLVVGEVSKPENRIIYPLNPERKPLLDDWWEDVPLRGLGPHDGLSDRMRAATAKR